MLHLLSIDRPFVKVTGFPKSIHYLVTSYSLAPLTEETTHHVIIIMLVPMAYALLFQEPGTPEEYRASVSCDRCSACSGPSVSACVDVSRGGGTPLHRMDRLQPTDGMNSWVVWPVSTRSHLDCHSGRKGFLLLKLPVKPILW